jgi:broad specificity phosphatase PhoE
MKSTRVFLAACVLALMAGAANADAQQTVFLVRHAERAASPTPPATMTGGSMTAPADDPPLSAAGNERSARLATMLRSADIKHIFTTQFLRSRQTAAPAADAMHLQITVIPSKDQDGVIARIRQAQGNVLVVGHSNTLPEVLKKLGVKDDIKIEDSEYDNLFIVVRPESGEPALIRLRF